jgi:SAM-dependent methyltransferase
VTPEDYEAWYDTPRGRWIGAIEYELLAAMLRPAPGSALLDVGCGTGHFTRLFAGVGGTLAVGLDPNEAWLSYARAHSVGADRYVAGRAESLPFPDRSFDYTVSITALCFVDDQERALRELLRVTRRRFALGLLNRHSLLYLQKGVGGGTGGYRGAHWHTAAELRALFSALPAVDLTLRTAVLVPHGGAWGRALEACRPRSIAAGGFLAVAGEPCATDAPRA